MSNIYSIIIVLMISIQGMGQNSLADIRTDDFVSPVDHQIILAGSFAELRSTHFHAGIDIKPSSRTSVDTVRCAADGTVSRIKIQSGGYGQAVYIDHPNGYTTVYAHLHSLTPEIGQYVKSLQMAAESYSIDVYPDPGVFTFSQGEALGIMGNTGNSYARHLHFEIRDTESEKPVNPALWGIKPKDTRPPEILSMDLHALAPDFNIQQRQTFYPKSTSSGSYRLHSNPVYFPAWRMGIGIQTFDKMNGANNSNGIYSLRLYVDDSLYYEIVMDTINWTHMDYINAHIDYPERNAHNRTVTKCYVTPGNRLDIYRNLRHKGVINLYEDRARKISIEIKDIQNNSSTLDFEVFRDKNIPVPESKTYNLLIPYDRDTTISFNGMKLEIPKGALDKNLLLSYGIKERVDSKVYTISEDATMLMSYATLTLPIPDTYILDKEKALIIYEDKDGNKNSYGGIVDGNVIKTRWKSGGDYYVSLDTIAPTIKSTAREKGSYSTGDVLQYIIEDDWSSVPDIRVEMNSHWHISPFKNMTSILEIPLTYNMHPGDNTLRIIATDEHGNSSTYEKIISYNQ